MLMAHGIALSQDRAGICQDPNLDCFTYNKLPVSFSICDDDFDLALTTNGTVVVSVGDTSVIQYINVKIHIVGPGKTLLIFDYTHGTSGTARSHTTNSIIVIGTPPI